QLGLIQLGTNDQSKREAGRIVLERLRTDPKQRAAATRTFIVDKMANDAEIHRVNELARELQSYPEAQFSDRLLYLEILRRLHDPEFSDYLRRLEQDAVSHAADLTSLFAWMSGNETAT